MGAWVRGGAEQQKEGTYLRGKFQSRHSSRQRARSKRLVQARPVKLPVMRPLRASPAAEAFLLLASREGLPTMRPGVPRVAPPRAVLSARFLLVPCMLRLTGMVWGTRRSLPDLTALRSWLAIFAR